MSATERPTSKTIEVSEAQRQILLSALADKLLDSKRYVSGMKPAETPGSMDACCDAHLAAYEHKKDIYKALKRQVKDVRAVIDLVLYEGEVF